jgi:hypothetical protein
LSVDDVHALLADTLKSQQNDQPGLPELVGLVYEKTQGNAFFVGQFLHALYEEELLRFEYPTTDHLLSPSLSSEGLGVAGSGILSRSALKV